MATMGPSQETVRNLHVDQRDIFSGEFKQCLLSSYKVSFSLCAEVNYPGNNFLHRHKSVVITFSTKLSARNNCKYVSQNESHSNTISVVFQGVSKELNELTYQYHRKHLYLAETSLSSNLILQIGPLKEILRFMFCSLFDKFGF